MEEIVERLKNYKYSVTEKIAGSQIKKVTGNTQLYIDDAIKSKPLKLNVDGNSYQETTTGKNIFDYISNLLSESYGLNNVLNEDGSITTTGIPNINYASVSAQYFITDDLEDGETYTMSQEPNTSVWLEVREKLIGTDTINKYYNSQSGSEEFVVDKSLYEYDARIIAGKIDDWGTASKTITNFYQIAKGTDLTFEKYTGGVVSPNPNYPQNIEVIKNVEALFDGELVKGSYNTATGEVDTTIYDMWRNVNFISVKENANYLVSIDGNKISLPVRWFFYDKDKNYLSTITSENGEFVTPSGTCYLNFHSTAMYINYPEGVENMTFSFQNLIKIYKKNKFSITSLIGYQYNNALPSKENSTIIINSFDVNNISFEISSINYLQVLTNVIELEPNTNYILKYKRTNKTIKASPRRWIYAVDENNSYSILNILNSGDEGNMYCAFTTPANGKIAIAFGYSNQATGSSSIINDITINKEEEINKYLIELQNNSLCKIGDVKDELNLTTGVLTKRIGKVVLDGSETWYKTSETDKNIFYVINMINANKNYADGVSNYFTNKNGYPNQVGVFAIREDGKSLFFNSELTTTDEFKNWLSSHNIEVYYPLATPEIIQLEPIDMQMYYGVNDIELITNLETSFDLDYISKDLLDMTNCKFEVKEL